MSALELTVVGVDDRIPGIRGLTLARRDGGPLPSFPPGSHLAIECGRVVNAYSLTGDGLAPTHYAISVLECPNGSGGSRWVHQLRVGDTVAARTPRSGFAPVLRATKHLLVAAGIGITPMVSHLRSAHRWGREAELFYVHREGRGAHLDDVERLAAGAAATFTDRGSFVAALGLALARQPLGTHLYVCGPGRFMADVTTLATDLGWPVSRIHLEHFGIAEFDPGLPFDVHLTATGDSFTVASGVSLLAALLARGHDIPNLCRQGVCGECRIGVTTGQVLHRDLFLTAAEREAGESLMCCVSRAAGDRLELAL